MERPQTLVEVRSRPLLAGSLLAGLYIIAAVAVSLLIGVGVEADFAIDCRLVSCSFIFAMTVDHSLS